MRCCAPPSFSRVSPNREKYYLPHSTHFSNSSFAFSQSWAFEQKLQKAMCTCKKRPMQAKWSRPCIKEVFLRKLIMLKLLVVEWPGLFTRWATSRPSRRPYQVKKLEKMSFVASKPFSGAKGKYVDRFNAYLQGYSKNPKLMRASWDVVENEKLTIG